MDKAARIRMASWCSYNNGDVTLTKEGILIKRNVPNYDLGQFLSDISTIEGGLNQEHEIKPITKKFKSEGFRVSTVEDLTKADFDITDDSFTLVPLNLSVEGSRTNKRHEVTAILCKNYKVHIFDTEGHSKCEKDFKTQIRTSFNNKIRLTIPGNATQTDNQKVEVYYINENKIQTRDGCTFNTVNFINIAKDYGSFGDLRQQIGSGEMQFKVMAETSRQMQSQTGNIQIIEKLGECVGEGVNVVIQGTGEWRYMEFNLGDTRFKMSLSTNESVTGNKYISRPGLIKSIGVQSVLEAMQQHQSELPENIKTVVEQRLLQLQQSTSLQRQPTVSPTVSQPINPAQISDLRALVGADTEINQPAQTQQSTVAAESPQTNVTTPTTTEQSDQDVSRPTRSTALIDTFSNKKRVAKPTVGDKGQKHNMPQATVLNRTPLPNLPSPSQTRPLQDDSTTIQEIREIPAIGCLRQGTSNINPKPVKLPQKLKQLEL